MLKLDFPHGRLPPPAIIIRATYSYIRNLLFREVASNAEVSSTC